MKGKETRFNSYGLRAKLGVSVCISLVASVVLFFVLNTGIGFLFANYYEQSGLDEMRIQKQCRSFQHYIDEHDISSDNLSLLKKWEQSQPVVLLELYEGTRCIYSSTSEEAARMIDPESEGLSGQRFFAVQLADKEVYAFIYSDFAYQFFVIRVALSFVLALAFFAAFFLKTIQKLIRYIRRLNEGLQILEGGNLDYCISEEGNDELTDLAKSMNRMRLSLKRQIEEEQRLNSANRQLVSQLSHDLRTPLTSMSLYLEILRTHHYETEEQMQNYLEIIDKKTRHIKYLSDHLFDHSQQDAVVVPIKPLPARDAFEGPLEVLVADLQGKGFAVERPAIEDDCSVYAEPGYLQRVFENIGSNVSKYADCQAPVVIQIAQAEGYYGVSVANKVSSEAAAVESNRIGLASVEELMNRMQGRSVVETTDSQFKITLLFKQVL